MTVVLRLIVGEKSHKFGRRKSARSGRFGEESAAGKTFPYMNGQDR